MRLEDFYREAYPILVRSLRRTTTQEIAEDIAQDALLRATERWDDISNLDQPTAWAHRVATNLIRSHYRHQQVRNSHSGRVNNWPANGDHSQEIVGLGQALELVADLGERERAVLILRYALDMPVAEVARALNCSYDAVCSLTWRAKEQARGEVWKEETSP